MNFFKSLFSLRTFPNGKEESLSPAFAEQVEYAIDLLSKAENSITNEQVLKLFDDHKIAPKEAVEIFLFLPIAFIRHLLPNMNWPDSYLELVSEKKFIEKKYSETPSFQIIWKVTAAHFQALPDATNIIKIAGRSAEFHSINELLIDNKEAKPEDVKLMKSIIIR